MAREGGRVGRGRAIQAKSSHETQTKKIQDKFEEVIFVDLSGLRAELENILCCFTVLLSFGLVGERRYVSIWTSKFYRKFLKIGFIQERLENPR